MSLDESSLMRLGRNPDEVKMGDHPIAWYHEYDGGRSFYTGFGHAPESFEDKIFKSHLAGGIEWAAGL
jgi:type 1 glutamine amidotransferase